ncbi:MAG: hypothetical protein CM15mP36_02040 [Flavobacteriales bacterium]|nr:MAG: hypothetical protein CM15mP36_02040 [Flavobacteriales bacterium]
MILKEKLKYTLLRIQLMGLDPTYDTRTFPMNDNATQSSQD